MEHILSSASNLAPCFSMMIPLLINIIITILVVSFVVSAFDFQRKTFYADNRVGKQQQQNKKIYTR